LSVSLPAKVAKICLVVETVSAEMNSVLTIHSFIFDKEIKLNSMGLFFSSAFTTSGWRGLATVMLLSALCLSVAQLRAEEPASVSVATDAAVSPIVNINSASAMLIADSLSGIGLVKAQAIVDYRTEHGEFLHIDELLDVPGIGEGIFARIKHLLVLDGTSETTGQPRT